MTFDDILAHVGDFGLYQKRILILICMAKIPAACHQLAQVFLGASVDFWCMPPELKSVDCPKSWNFTSKCDEVKRTAVTPPDDYNCYRYANVTVQSFLEGILPSSGWPLQSCESWEYDTSQYKSTIIQEWDLVCDDKTQPAIGQSVFFAGVLFGSFFFGSLADRIGRKPSLFLAIGLQCAFGIAVAFSPTYFVFVCLRFVVAFANVGVFMLCFVIATEMIATASRSKIMFMSCFWSFGCMVLALLAYFIRSWKKLAIAIALPGLVFLLFIPVLPESVRWLISKHKVKEVEKIIKKIAKTNKTTLPEKYLNEQGIKEHLCGDGTTRGSFIDLFRTPNMRKKTINLMFNWFVNSCVYYGLSLNTSGLGVDEYIAFLVFGAIEIPAYLLNILLLDYLGRRVALCSTMVLGGLACILTIWMPLGVWRTLTAMVGKFGITASFAVVFLFSAELFPTPVRSIGMGTSSVSARVGGILSPFILEIENVWKPLPLIIFGTLSVAAGLLALLLPETNGRELPETLEDGEIFTRDSCVAVLNDMKIDIQDASRNHVSVDTADDIM